jgi:RpiB/LacA/LacB family sugar-phosphate isomerase
MKIAVGSDMNLPVARSVVESLKKRGHEVEPFGALLTEPAPWPRVGQEVAEKVADGSFDQAVLFCWTGTGISIAANKVRGIRAALCQDAQTADGARKWNDANILCMSLRATSEPIAEEILDAWFAGVPSQETEDQACLAMLE